MATKSDFWLLIHGLANALRSEGHDRDARQQSITDAFESMPAVAQAEVMHDYRLLVAELTAAESKLLVLSLKTEAAPASR